MGYYVEVPSPVDKASQLVSLYDAEYVTRLDFDEVPEDKYLICVVENAFFDAAAVVYSRGEFEAFQPTIDDDRSRTWLYLSKEVVEGQLPLIAGAIEKSKSYERVPA